MVEIAWAVLAVSARLSSPEVRQGVLTMLAVFLVMYMLLPRPAVVEKDGTTRGTDLLVAVLAVIESLLVLVRGW